MAYPLYESKFHERQLAKLAARQKQNDEFRKTLKEMRASNPVKNCHHEAKKCCSENWKIVEKETNLIKNHPDDIERNKQINAAYADLNLKDPEGQKWAGTAAIVSKQAGCTMQNNVIANTFTKDSLGRGNIAIFENIYPSLKMYELSKNSMTKEEFLKCMDNTVGKSKVGKKNLAPLKKAVKSMYNGKGDKAAKEIAVHEQGNIIENAMWKSWSISISSWINQSLWSYAVDTNVYFVGDCTKPSNRELKFGSGNLSNPDTRIKFYEDRFVPYYDKLDKKEMGTIMKTIRNTGGTH